MGWLTLRVGRAFERGMWLSRYVVLVPVVFCALLAAAAFYIATVDAISVLVALPSYANPEISNDHHSHLRATLVATTVKAVDVYLLAVVLLIVAAGLYELAISKIEIPEHTPLATRLLRIHSLDDLKNRLAKVILLVLVVEFLQQALQLRYTNSVEVLYLAGGTLMVSGALYLASRYDGSHDG